MIKTGSSFLILAADEVRIRSFLTENLVVGKTLTILGRPFVSRPDGGAPVLLDTEALFLIGPLMVALLVLGLVLGFA